MSDCDYLEFRHLKYVLAIANAESFSTAANNLFLAQSSLSTQIQKLEDYYNVQLFRRGREGYEGLTDAGHILVAAAKEMLQQRDDLVDILKSLATGAPPPLKLGFSSLVEKATLGTVVNLARDVYPSCEIVSDGDEVETLEARVRNGDLDGALVTLPLNDSSDLSTCVVEKERLVVCMRADDELAKHDAIPAHAINGKLGVFEYPLVHHAAHQKLLELLNGVGIQPKDIHPTQNREHVQWLVHERQCYALIRGGRSLMPGLTTRPIHGTNWTIDTALILRSATSHPALALLLREVKKRAWRFGAALSFKKPVASEKIGQPLRKRLKRAQSAGMPLFDSD